MYNISQNPPRSSAETPKKDFQSVNEETILPGFLRAIKSVLPKKILKEKKSKPSNVFQHASLISRKIEQLNHQGRTYLLQVDNPLGGNTPKESLTDALPVNTTGVLQYVSKGDLRRFNRKANNHFDHKEIACRHLAYAFATGKFGTKDVGKFTSIDQLDKISRHSGIKTDQALQDTTADGHKTAQEGYYFDRDGVGQAIHEACQQQLADGEQNKTFLFSSSIHSMALKINWSPERSEIKLVFYDPCDTLRVRRLIVSDLQTLKAIKLEHLVPDSDIKLYYPELDYPKPYLGGCLTTTTVESRAGSSLVRVLADMNPSILFLMLTNGHFSSKMVVQFPGQLNRLDSYNQKIALMAKDHDGFPGLHTALQNGHGECVKKYLDRVSPFSDEFKQDLLMAKSHKGFPGLYAALQNGHGECVKTYLDLVMASPFSDKVKQNLLMAKSPDGFPGLCAALDNGHVECVKSYLDRVMASSLSDEVKLNLLMAKSSDGFPGLYVALQNGHGECVKTYLDWVMASPFSDEVKQDLLMAKSSKGYLGLFVALQNGHWECVKSYVDWVMASPFSDEVKQDLLMAKSPQGNPGFFVALQNGHWECVKSYVDWVMASPFSDEFKQNLLMAKSSQGFPGLFVALIFGDDECVKGYLSLVMASPLSDEVKQNLLIAKSSDGYPGLFAALENGHYECVKGYLSLVKASPFCDKIKNNLLMATRGDSISGLCVTLKNGKRESLRTYVTQVINSSLSHVSKQFDD